MTQSYAVTAHSDAPPEKVFALVADGAGWSSWAGPFIFWSGWEVEGDPAPGGVGAIRLLGLKRVHTRERIEEYDPPHRLSYSILSGVPVKDYLAVVELTPEDGGTRIIWRGTFEPKVPGTGAATRIFLRTTIADFTRRLAKAAAAS
jgi:uncharacterized protein YndB with AHSA1/START domain